jgi:hypothetical protein
MYRRNVTNYGGKAVLLDDADVIIVDGRKMQVLH